MVERKIMQAHAAAVARLHMDKYEKPKLRLQIMHQYGIPLVTEKELAEWLIHQKALEALDKTGAEAPTFRAMLKADLGAMRQRWDEAERARDRNEKNAAAERVRVAARKKEEEWLFEEQRNRLRAELAAHEAAMKNAKMSLDACSWLIFAGAVGAVLLLARVIGQWTTNQSLDAYGLFWVILVSAATVAVYLIRRKIKTHLAKMRGNWDRAHSGAP
jgi:hypothetical protein